MLRFAVICDLLEENWPSMDLVAEMFVDTLRAQHAATVQATHICPPMKRRLSRLPWLGAGRTAVNADRLANRFWDYPRFLRRYRNAADVFHVVDHSYAQLVLELPARRTLVTCHDIDTFRCLHRLLCLSL